MAEILRLQPAGYIAFYRALFDHALFRSERPFTRLQAWAWLICDAAWKVEQRRIGGRLVTLERGQTAVTVRSLGKTWGWSIGAVQRFLGTLKRHTMVRTLVTDTAPGTAPDTGRRAAVTILTICNYSKFQDPPAAEKSEPIQGAIQQPKRRGQQVLDLGDGFDAQEVNQPTKKAKVRAADRGSGDNSGAWPEAPRHLQVSKKHGTIYVERGTPEWNQYAADYMAARGGTMPFPNAYNGAGRWFSYDGEEAAMQRSAERRRRRA